MKNNGKALEALLSKSLILGTLLIVTNTNTQPARAIDPADDAGVFGSISVAKQAREGVKAMNNRDYAKAAQAYRAAINLKGDVPEFYYGLLFVGQQSEAWDQVSIALDGIAEKDPAARPHLAYEYGNCYTKTGRFDEAIPLLKAALNNRVADNDFLHNKIQKLVAMANAPAPPVVPTEAEKEAERKREEELKKASAPPPVVPILHQDTVNPNTSERGSDFLNAFLQSEWIGICEYKGYKKQENILFNNPPIANFYWTQCLKGPPLNHDLPIRFKFYEYDAQTRPEGWKFGEDKMPAKGSKWLIFLQPAVPREGAFDTYRGSFGRQEANEANLGEIYAIREAHHGQQ